MFEVRPDDGNPYGLLTDHSATITWGDGTPTSAGTIAILSGCGGVASPPVSNDYFEYQLIQLVDQERSSRGLPPFKRMDALDRAAVAGE